MPHSTTPPPTITPAMNVDRALDVYLTRNGFSRAAYDDRWTPASLLGVRFAVPNTANHRWTIMRHDLHHVVTGYKTDLAGEAEISCWELAAGLDHIGLYTRGIVRSLAGYGMARHPIRAARAYRASARKSLYQDTIPYERALAMTVGALREALGVPPEGIVPDR